MSVAPSATASSVSAVADSLWLFPNFPGGWGVGDHPPLPGHDAARDRRTGSQPNSRYHRHSERQNHGKGGPRGYDAAKKVKGRKRHIGVDTSGFLLGVIVHAANIQDAEGAWDLLKRLKSLYCWLRVIFADSSYNRLTVLLACFLLGLR